MEVNSIRLMFQVSLAHPLSSPMCTGDSYPRGKVTGAWSWPLMST